MLEIERKFLVKPSAILNASEAYLIIQGYIAKNENGSVRLRIESPLMKFKWWELIIDIISLKFFSLKPFPKKRAYLMSKIKTDQAISNNETVDEISISNANTLLQNFSNTLIRKIRYVQYVKEKKWEIDVFEYPNKGMMVAEIELNSIDEEIYFPEWIIKEVTGDPQYYNANMK